MKCDIEKQYNHCLITALMVGALALPGCTSGDGDSATIAVTDQDSDPVVLEIPIAYIRRPIPLQADDFDLRNPTAFNPGAELLTRSRSSNLAEEINLTPLIKDVVALEEGLAASELAIDIKDLETSFNGETLIFAARVVPEPVNNNLEFTTWNLWTYHFETQELQYLIPSRLTRNEGADVGGGQDIAPHFLTDDRIIFSSTRQTTVQSRLLNEGRGQLYAALDDRRNTHATVLHTYDPDSDEIQQISFNQSHDLDPSTLDSGEIVFSRWNNAAGSNNHISLYKINPSGRGLSLLYGQHSADSGTPSSTIEFTQARETEDGNLLTLIRPFVSDSFGGNIVSIDKNNYVEIDQPTWANQGNTGAGQVGLTNTEIRTDNQLSTGGQLSTAYPLKDGTGRVLVSWSQCRVIDSNGLFIPCNLEPTNTTIAPPLYGLWMFDFTAGTQQPVVTPTEGFMLTEIVAGEPRNFPAIPDEMAFYDSNLDAEDSGLIRINSVYDIDGTDSSATGISSISEPGTAAYTNRPARFIRIIQPVPIPDNDVRDIPGFAFGVSSAQSMREILGYAPVEPDGSVTLKVPANTPFMLSALDINGRRLGERHDHWLQIGSGEILECTGCHTGNSELPHGRRDSQPTPANPGAQSLTGGIIGFISTVPDLFGTAIGQTMAEIYDLRRPNGNESQVERDLSLHITYSDEWTNTGSGLTPDPAIDYTYDPAWTDIPADKPIIVDNLDPTLPGRIVINYIDHIQPIWERTRTPIDDGSGNLIDTCVGCHTSNNNAQVPAGQLDLTATASDINADHLTSYRELLSGDNEIWLNVSNVPAERQRECTVNDPQGNPVVQIMTFPVASTMQSSGANNSNGFFACFEQGPAQCGRFQQDVSLPPANCVDNGTIQVDTPVDHRGALSPSELRLISEWLDIGAQYYNNPFDSRLD